MGLAYLRPARRLHPSLCVAAEVYSNPQGTVSMTSSLSKLSLIALLALAACGGDDAADETTPPADTTQATATAQPDTASQPAPSTSISVAKINLNTGTEEEFRTIPGVGDKMVHEFEEYRPYVSIAQFRKEIGKYVDEAQVATYEQYVFVPIDPNKSDAETLQQIPGVDASEAKQLVAMRPFDSNQAFLDRLSPMVDGDVSLASSYLVTQ
jgi:DNA uptake protein ComE-like DNA-binding protein